MRVGVSSDERLVLVDFRCERCGLVETRQVRYNIWEEKCGCGGVMRRQIAVQFMFPQVLREDNVDVARAANEDVEPDEKVIRAVHWYNYQEEPDKQTIRDVKKHKLVVW